MGEELAIRKQAEGARIYLMGDTGLGEEYPYKDPDIRPVRISQIAGRRALFWLSNDTIQRKKL